MHTSCCNLPASLGTELRVSGHGASKICSASLSAHSGPAASGSPPGAVSTATRLSERRHGVTATGSQLTSHRARSGQVCYSAKMLGHAIRPEVPPQLSWIVKLGSLCARLSDSELATPTRSLGGFGSIPVILTTTSPRLHAFKYVQGAGSTDRRHACQCMVLLTAA